MMNFLKSTKRLFGIYFGRMTIEKRLLFSHVERDWMIMFCVFIVALFAIIIFSLCMFFSIVDENLIIERSATARGVETLDREKLNELVNFFNERATNFEKIKENPPKVPSPIE